MRAISSKIKSPTVLPLDGLLALSFEAPEVPDRGESDSALMPDPFEPLEPFVKCDPADSLLPRKRFVLEPALGAPLSLLP
mmetsp:Transcript_40537/g.122437  ORF Transcript_40537/g.122437 Transcript_40537/m.122437 type:complete len:80 (-) Transcript_40537:1045-1284(-)